MVEYGMQILEMDPDGESAGKTERMDGMEMNRGVKRSGHDD